jgi:signal transduction histidine kinase
MGVVSGAGPALASPADTSAIKVRGGLHEIEIVGNGTSNTCLARFRDAAVEKVLPRADKNPPAGGLTTQNHDTISTERQSPATMIGRTMWPHRLAKMPLRLPLLFALLTLVPAVALGWLTFELVRTDRELEQERLRERADTAAERAADRIVAASHQRLTDLERLVGASGALPPDVIRVDVDGDKVSVNPPAALAYYPDAPDIDEQDAVFADGERIEYGERNSARAAEWFAQLAAGANDPALRAGALLRLARNQHKGGDVAAALATYDRMATIEAVVAGTPAELLALVGRSSVLEAAGRAAETKSTGQRLLTGLNDGRWRLGRTTYETYLEQARRWAGDATQAISDRHRAASAFADIYDRWRADGHAPPRGWRVVDGGLVVTAGASDTRRLTVLIAGIAFLQQAWSGVPDVDVILTTPEGTRLLGALRQDGWAAVRTPDASGLPWTLRVAGGRYESDSPEGIVRRQLRLWGVVLVLMLLGGSAYVTWRGVSRELAVARLQADFVAAVSHEFRTPLASLRHLSDMLAQRRVPDEDQRQQCYDHLVRESGRLERLVEELLDFGRLEEGQYRFTFEPVALSSLVSDVVATFEQHSGARRHRVQFSSLGEVTVPVDRPAFTRALWNLLDNAAKYSPDADTIWVQLSVDDREAVIRVRDQGLGIDPGEQAQIFGKFVRGSSERVRHVSGTGLGLAMVRHIVSAHGGHVSVESEPNKGSTFALTLPLGAPYVGRPLRGAAA